MKPQTLSDKSFKMGKHFRLSWIVYILIGLILTLESGAQNASTMTPLKSVQPYRVFTEEVIPVGPFLGVIPVRVKTWQEKPIGAIYMMNSLIKQDMQVFMDTDSTLSFDYSAICLNRNISFFLKASVFDYSNLEVTGNDRFEISCKNAREKGLLEILSTPLPVPKDVKIPSWTVYVTRGKINVKLSSGIIGTNGLKFSLVKVTEGAVELFPQNQTDSSYSDSKQIAANTFYIPDRAKSSQTFIYPINIIRQLRPVDQGFRLVMYLVQIFVATGFGAKLDLQVVKANLWRPVAPGIGLSCQYLLMPLIAFAVANVVPVDNKAVSLGIFVAGCCPGGGASNMYSYLLRGDLSLSITMTALSTMFALGLLPLWLYTLGTTFTVGEELNIPFSMVAVSLSILITPLCLGLFLKQKFPKVAKLLEKILKPVVLVMSLILIIVGIYSNLFIFRLFKPRIILAACLLPYVGYICGGIVAFIFRQDWKKVKTIALETGMQNTSIAYILLINSFGPPAGDIAAIGPMASALVTPLPPFTITIFYLLYQKYCNKNNDDDDDNDDVEKSESDVDGAGEKLTSEMTEVSTPEHISSDEKTALATV